MNQHYVDRLLSLMSMNDAQQRSENAWLLWEDLIASQNVPVVHNNRAYFLYYGDAQSVLIAGDWTFWQPAIVLERVPDTKLFYAIQEFPTTARLQYKVIVNGNWMLDPANKRSSVEGFGLNSEFWMPDYIDESFQKVLSDTQKGEITRHTLYSSVLKQERELYVYKPSKTTNTATPILIINDGREAITIGHFNTVLDNLINDKVISPCAAVFIPPRDRMYEYPESTEYLSFVAKEVLPYAKSVLTRANMRISESVNDVAITGASLGGLVSTKIALKFPELFGVCIPQSPSYWWNHGDIYRSQDLYNARKVRFILQTGTICDARQLTLRMMGKLQQLGANVEYQEYHQGHTWGNWRSNFANAIRAWLAPKNLGTKAA